MVSSIGSQSTLVTVQHSNGLRRGKSGSGYRPTKAGEATANSARQKGYTLNLSNAARAMASAQGTKA